MSYSAWACVNLFRWPPNNNDAWFASPAVDLLVRHRMGTPILEGAGTWLAGIDQHTYWTMPLYSLVLAAWYWCFGISFMTQRLLTFFLGIGLLLCVYALVRKLSTEWAAVVSVVFISCDYEFVKLSVLGRMDMLCAFLGFAGLAIYVNLRETRFRWAIVLANIAAAAACMTHPYGVLGMATLWALMLHFDRKRLGWREVALAGAPYVIALALWGVYILPAPASFLAQMKGNVTGIQAQIGGSERFNLMLHPRRAFKAEMWTRYADNYRSAFMPRVYLLGLVSICILAWRRRTSKNDVAVALIAGIYFFGLMLLEGTRREAYLVQPVPALAMALAVVLCSIKLPRRYPVAAVIIGVTLVVTFQEVSEFRKIPATRGPQDYFSVVRFLGANYLQGQTLIAPPEFAYKFGFYGGLTDDWQIGYYSGKSPEFIVAGRLTNAWLKQHRNDSPEFARFVSDRLGGEYVVVLQNPNYTVYAKREGAASVKLEDANAKDAGTVKMFFGLHP